jgi:catechol 2,3-dioxygenase
MGIVTLKVAQLARQIAFYTQVIGLRVLAQSPTTALLGVDVPLLALLALPNAQPQPRRSTGLFHLALLVPSRADLGRVLANLVRYQVRIGGGDHFVSEAVYLNDPEGNGIELYRDRPRHEWTWQGTQVHMGTVELDFAGILNSVPDPDQAFQGLPNGTTMGHVHLKVGDIAQAEAFYSGVLGFDVVARMEDSALFVSAGGYHHHLGLNVWQSLGAPPLPVDSIGLAEFTIVVPDATALTPITQRLQSIHTAYTQDSAGLHLQDPWQNQILIQAMPTK